MFMKWLVADHLDFPMTGLKPCACFASNCKATLMSMKSNLVPIQRGLDLSFTETCPNDDSLFVAEIGACDLNLFGHMKHKNQAILSHQLLPER
ncbi:hypothetical protein Ahy_A09g046465 isoform C [Arachis hypogaea]|uniref:Uncharacterized protein n=1 Tax=Arachis hypogaea TaxID=3818 RepID=A0A445BQ02_ARAHY|nr:hypothetical protein Ahy_A09g046465 isoform C [Arachis hypogaea]